MREHKHKLVYELAGEDREDRHFRPVTALWSELPQGVKVNLPRVIRLPKNLNPHDVELMLSFKTGD